MLEWRNEKGIKDKRKGNEIETAVTKHDNIYVFLSLVLINTNNLAKAVFQRDL